MTQSDQQPRSPRRLPPTLAKLILRTVMALIVLGIGLYTLNRRGKLPVTSTTTSESPTAPETVVPPTTSRSEARAESAGITPTPSPSVVAPSAPADIFAIEFARDGRLMVARRDGVSLHDLSSGTRTPLAIKLPDVRDVSFSRDGQSIAFAAGDGTPTLIWSIVPQSARNLPASAEAVRFAFDSRTLVTGHSNGEVKLWDAIAWNCTATLRVGVGPVRDIAVAPNGGFIAVAGQDVAVWELSAKRLRTKIGAAECPSVVFSPDSNVIAAAGETGVTLWESVFWQRIATLSPGQPVTRVAYWRSGTSIVMSLADGSVQLWDATTRQRMVALPSRGAIIGFALSPDDRTLATATRSDVTLWDTTTRDPRPLP
jgi:WD40 repeat protein